MRRLPWVLVRKGHVFHLGERGSLMRLIKNIPRIDIAPLNLDCLHAYMWRVALAPASRSISKYKISLAQARLEMYFLVLYLYLQYL